MYNLEDILDDEMEFEEGANKDARAAFKEAKTTYKENIRAARKTYKSGDYASAKKHVAVAKNALDEAASVISTIDSSLGEVMIGAGISFIKEGVKELILAIPTFGLGAAVAGLKYIVDQNVESIDAAVKRGSAKRGDHNLNINDFKIAIKKMKATIEQMEKKIAEAEKASGGSGNNNASEEDSEAKMESAGMIFEKEISLLSSFYEDADSTTVDQFFIESAIGDGIKGLIEKAVKVIQDLIQNFTEFCKNVRSKIHDQKVKADLNKLKRAAKKKIQFKIRDNDVRAYYKDLATLSTKYTLKAKKIHDAFTRGKMSYEDCERLLEENDKELDKLLNVSYAKHKIGEEIGKKDINTTLEVGKAVSIIEDLSKEQEKIISVIQSTVIEEHNSLLKAVKSLQNKIFKEDGEDEEIFYEEDDPNAKQRLQQEVNIKTKIANKLSVAGRKISSTVAKHKTEIAAVTALIVGYKVGNFAGKVQGGMKVAMGMGEVMNDYSVDEKPFL